MSLFDWNEFIHDQIWYVYCSMVMDWICLALFPVYGPLEALYSTCHIHPFTHTITHWWLPCKVLTCSLGAIWGSVSCSRILGPTQPPELQHGNCRNARNQFMVAHESTNCDHELVPGWTWKQMVLCIFFSWVKTQWCMVVKLQALPSSPFGPYISLLDSFLHSIHWPSL